MDKKVYSNTLLPNQVLQDDLLRLTNQIWKLIPMYENNEDWHSHLSLVISEILGLYKILDLNSLIILSKLEGLRLVDMDFLTYRSTVFKSINLLHKDLNE